MQSLHVVGRSVGRSRHGEFHHRPSWLERGQLPLRKSGLPRKYVFRRDFVARENDLGRWSASRVRHPLWDGACGPSSAGWCCSLRDSRVRRRHRQSIPVALHQPGAGAHPCEYRVRPLDPVTGLTQQILGARGYKVGANPYAGIYNRPELLLRCTIGRPTGLQAVARWGSRFLADNPRTNHVETIYKIDSRVY